MLVLSRHRDETIMIGDDTELTIIDIRGDKVRIGIHIGGSMLQKLRRDARAGQRRVRHRRQGGGREHGRAREGGRPPRRLGRRRRRALSGGCRVAQRLAGWNTFENLTK